MVIDNGRTYEVLMGIGDVASLMHCGVTNPVSVLLGAFSFGLFAC